MPANPQVTDEMVELAAQALYIAMDSFDFDVRVDSLTPAERQHLARCALTAALTDHLAGWRDIEGAPKMRKLITGHFNEHGKWRSYMATYYKPGTLDAADSCDNPDEDGYAPEGWYEESETQDEIMPVRPSHWMPLPAAPLPQKEG